MLFHSTKKPTELVITNLNNKQALTKKRFDVIAKLGENDKASFCKKLCTIKQLNKQDKSNQATNKPILFVLDYAGDIKASATDKLREEISAIISVAKKDDEVLLRLESAGGQVHGYGLAAAQLARLKDTQIKLTVCVDKVAASGGYMMACVADELIAAPFAIIGSIGVVSQIPNFHDFLKKHDIDVELFTAGEYKRTVTMFGKNDEADRAKYQSELERIHELFKNHVASHRPNLDVEKVATGEFWFATDAKTLGLIDDKGTSDSYLLEKMKTHTALHLHSRQKLSPLEKLGLAETSKDIAVQALDSVKTVLQSGVLSFKNNTPTV